MGYDVYVIIATPFKGYGSTYVWATYHTYENAIAAFNALLNEYQCKPSMFSSDLAFATITNPDFKHRFYSFEIKGYYFED